MSCIDDIIYFLMQNMNEAKESDDERQKGEENTRTCHFDMRSTVVVSGDRLGVATTDR